MGHELAETFPAARRVFEEADNAVGFPLSKLCFGGSAKDLQLTANTQPAILAASVAAAEVLRERGVQPDFVAGHSLGEYSALVSSGALQLADAVRLVRKRGEFMQEAVPVGQGAMAALLGLDSNRVEEICKQAAEGEVISPANFNSPSQIVIAGSSNAVERALKVAEACGAKRAVRLEVSAPFHCALMKPAEERLAPYLDATEIRDCRVPLVNNVDAEVTSSAAAIRDGLKRQVTAPVRWEQSVRVLQSQGVELFIEVGPGKVLSGLLRRIDRQATSLNVEDSSSLNQVLTQLGKNSDK